jgi:hypothetical protein
VVAVVVWAEAKLEVEAEAEVEVEVTLGVKPTFGAEVAAEVVRCRLCRRGWRRLLMPAGELCCWRPVS